MKLVIDENLSPTIARVLVQVVEGHEFLHVSEWPGAGTPDELLFEHLARDGAVLFTCDRNQRRTPRIKEALLASAITTFFADEAWSHSGRFEQVRRMLNWWPEMLAATERNWPGSWFQVPFNVRSTRLTRLPNSPGRRPE